MRKRTSSAILLVGVIGVIGAGVAGLAPASASAAATSVATSSAVAALKPPPVTVLTDKGGQGGGDIFVTPSGDPSAYGNGAEILSPNSKKVVWFHQAPARDEDTDFRTQTYEGKPVLTFWEGTGFGGVSDGVDYIYNDKYQKIATVKSGNGGAADGHEFLITPWNTALILSYSTATANLTSIGGPKDQAVINGEVQEIDIKTGKVLFQWKSQDHVPYGQSEEPLPASASTPWDWFHINAVKLDSNGNLLIDARDTWTTYEVSLHSGKILWQLGGKDSSFKLTAANGLPLDDAGEIFAWQHDAEGHGDGVYTVFDDESAGAANTGTNSLTDYGYSRAVTVKLNVRTHVATLVATDNEPDKQLTTSQGNAQLLPGGDMFVGWGALPYISEFSPSGQLIFNAEFPAGVDTYRAYRLPWDPAQ
ncbi:MAG TPA: arylsulfotransferase family protein [Trebonia sp.]